MLNEFQRIAVKHQQEEQMSAFEYLPQNNASDQTTFILSDTGDRYLFPQSSQNIRPTAEKEGFFQRFCSGIKYIFTGQSEPTPQFAPAQTNNNNMVYGNLGSSNFGSNRNLYPSMIFIKMDLIRKGMSLIFQLTVEHPLIKQRAVNTVLSYESVDRVNYMQPPLSRPISGELMHLDLM